MRAAYGSCVILIAAVAGCTPGTGPPGSPARPSAGDPAETAVRGVISELLKVDSPAIPMDMPISERPLNADELDLVEMVMELEERQDVVISDAALQRYAGGKSVIQITPNQLVLIVREAAKPQQSGRNR